MYWLMGGRAASALACDYRSAALHDRTLAVGVPWEAPVGVAVGVDEAGDGGEALGVDDGCGVSLWISGLYDSGSFYGDAACVGLVEAVYYGGVDYEGVVFGHMDRCIFLVSGFKA